jgi:hypothetical protein
MQKEKEIKQKLGLQGYFALQPCDCILDVSGCDRENLKGLNRQGI